MNDIDRTPRYAPSEVLTFCNDGKARRLPVAQYVAHPIGNHPVNCPLIQDCVALEMVTPLGTRAWWGFERAWINSELRMVVSGFSSRCELRSKWEVCNQPV